MPKSDWHQIFPYIITSESHNEVMKIKEMNFDWYANSPCQHLRKCIKNSMENMDTDVRVQRVNARISF